jgi:hypothetical protein
MNELLARLNDSDMQTCLLVVGKFPNTVSGLIQLALHTVEVQCGELGLSLNPDKTGLVAFTRKRKLRGLFEHCLFSKALNAACRSSIWE